MAELPQQNGLHSVGRYKYQSVLPEDSRTSDAVANYSTKTPLPWRPVYLRRAVLLSFAALFILIAIAIGGLLAVSNKNNGIATANSTEHYLWTYGPTAFLTAVAAVWARTEYQSKLVAPWIRLSRHRQTGDGNPASRTVLLDYVSEFSIIAVFRSLRYRDFTVSITTLVSLIIKVLIVLSSSLIYLDTTTYTKDSYPLVLQNRFVDSKARLANAGSLSLYILRGLKVHNLTFPDGISSEYAYQSVQTDLPGISQSRVITDGLKNSLQCEAVEVELVGAQHLDLYVPEVNITISSPSCNVASFAFQFDWTTAVNNSEVIKLFDRVQCEAVKGDNGRRLLALYGRLHYHLDTSRNTTSSIHKYADLTLHSAQLLCTPTYAIDRVEVTRNGTHTISIMPLQMATSRMLDSVSAWDILDAQFEANAETGKADSGIWEGLPTDDSQAATLLDPTVLQDYVEVYYQQITAAVCKTSLMEPVQETASGSVTLVADRLFIHSSVALAMVVLLIICILLTATAVFIVPQHGFLPNSTSTLFNSIPLFLWSRELLDWLRYAGASDGSNLSRSLESSTFESGLAYDIVPDQPQYWIDIDTKEENQGQNHDHSPQINSKNSHPAILHPISRLGLCLVVAGIMIALELLLHQSNLEDGLGDINADGENYIHYAWTVVPAVVFGALSMTYSAVDFKIRSLAPYMALKGYVSKDVFTHLELLDMAIPVAMYKELRLKTPWALATTAALLFASLFTTLSASLFQELVIPSTTSIELRANQSFLFDDTTNQVTYDVASLIFESNLSFPRFTFNDLAFPQLLPSHLPSSNNTYLNDSALSISAVIPALRVRMDCRSYKPASIHTNLTLNYTDKFGTHNPLAVIIDEENCNPSLLANDLTFETFPNTTYFTYDITGQFLGGSCSNLLYLWGKIDYATSPIIQHIEAIGCNSTFEAVDVNTTFVGLDLDIDVEKPPLPLEATARNTSFNNAYLPAFDIQIDGYSTLASIDIYPQKLSPLFALMVTSPWAIPISALGDPTASDSVIDAIRLHHGIIQAQTLANTLVPANTTNATLAESFGPGDNDARPRYNASVTDATGRRRVVQDAVSTHVLVALLGVTLVLFIAGWASSPGTDVLPRSPTTIASVAALLAGGNIFHRLQPQDGESLENAIAALGGPDARFWMGWGNLPDEEGRLSGGENEAGVSQFGIFVVGKDEVERGR
ncbi:hypothetical protein F4678DRAFT_419421 [Xylaria arbuscula]|nr:hypothetical protein F4678DRAFT_419421 [Xylaria arbuscula]